MNNMRSEGWFSWLSRGEKVSPPTPREKWLTVGLKANIGWPQAFDMIAISLADEILSEIDFNFGEFMASEAEPEQVQTILASARAAHSTYQIRVRWQWLMMHPRRIKLLWQQYRDSTVAILIQVWNSLPSDADQKKINAFLDNPRVHERQLAMESIKTSLENPENADKIQLMRQVIKVFLEVIQSDEGKALSEDYKAEVQKRNQESGPIPLFPFEDVISNAIMISNWVTKFYQLAAKQLQSSEFDHLPPEIRAAALRMAHARS